MALGVLGLEVYLVALSLGVLVVADLGFAVFLGREYLEARAEAETLARELRGGGLSKRAAAKRLARLESARARLRRLGVARLLVLGPAYAVAAVLSLAYAVPLPAPCCIPGLTVEVKGVCVTTSALLVALAFLAGLPLVQEEAVLLLLASRRRGRPS